jgi:hypothetical protein
VSRRSNKNVIRLWLSAVGLALLAITSYCAASVYLITYEDHYAEAMGPFWSLRSMTIDQKVAYCIAAFLTPVLLVASVGMVGLAIKRTFQRRFD